MFLWLIFVLFWIILFVASDTLEYLLIGGQALCYLGVRDQSSQDSVHVVAAYCFIVCLAVVARKLYWIRMMVTGEDKPISHRAHVLFASPSVV